MKNITHRFNKKSTITIAVLLLLSVAVTSVYPNFVNAHSPPLAVNSYTYVTASPNPVGISQQVLIAVFSDSAPPGGSLDPSSPAWTFYIDVMKPDGTNTTIGPLRSDSTGGTYAKFTPDKVGNYTIVGRMSEYTIPSNIATYGNDTWLASVSDPVRLVVQEEQVPAWPSNPLPTEYWSYPINGQNREWASLASNWLSTMEFPIYFGGVDMREVNLVQPYGLAPNSAHVIWTKPITFGGIADDYFGDESYYNGITYEPFFTPPVIIQGRLYYNNPTPTSTGRYGFVCVDLQTGEKLWEQNYASTNSAEQTYPGFGTTGSPQLSFGQILRFDTPNQYGTFAYLWSTVPGGSSGYPSGYNDKWIMADAFTGQPILQIDGVPSYFFGKTGVDTNGNVLRYPVGTNNAWLACWNSTAAISKTNPTQWRPALGATINASNGYVWNVTLPTNIPTGSQVIGIDMASKVLLFSTNVGSVNSPRILPSPDVFSQAAVSIDPATPGKVLWTANQPFPQGNVTLSLATIGDGVFTIFVKETRQYYCYDLETGKLLWGPTASQQALDVYTNNGFGNIGTVAYGKLYSANWGGVLYAYDIKNGTLLWTYEAKAGDESQYGGNYPLFVGAVADNKIFLYTAEHSPSQPLMRGAMLRAIDANTGQEVWKSENYVGGSGGLAAANFGNPIAIASGYLVTLNAYDNQIYCYGKGPTVTTVSAPNIGATTSTPVTIAGTVTDSSAGAKQQAVTANYPNGLPCVSDASMSQFMEAVYQQQPLPLNVTGVSVALSVVDANGNFRQIGETTTDAFGNYAYTWSPDISGSFQVIASFAGTNSYYPSSASTTFYASDAATPAPTPVQQTGLATTNDLIMYLAIGVIAIIVAVAIATVLLLRKRP